MTEREREPKPLQFLLHRKPARAVRTLLLLVAVLACSCGSEQGPNYQRLGSSLLVRKSPRLESDTDCFPKGASGVPGRSQAWSDLPEPWHYWNIDDRTQPGLALPPPGEVRFGLNVRPDSRLHLSFAVASASGEVDERMAIFDVSVRSHAKSMQLDRITFKPSVRPQDHKWKPRMYDLGKYRVGPAELVVTTQFVSSGTAQTDTTGFLTVPVISEPVLHLGGRQPDHAQNVILVSLDTLRADRLGCYGYSRDTSPNLDRLAAEDIVFETAIAQSNWTLSSHASMLTSLYVSSHGVSFATQSVRETNTLAAIMKEHGYYTAAFVDGGYMRPEYGFYTGFDAYETHDFHGFRRVMPSVEYWLREELHEPFLLFVHTYDVHGPYGEHEEFRNQFPEPAEGVSPELVDLVSGRYVVQRRDFDFVRTHPMSDADLKHVVNMYDSGVMYVDGQMGYLFEMLKDLELWDETLIVVTSDHGESFLEHGRLGHGATLFDEEICVPLIMRIPGGPNGIRVSRVVELIDIPPTILDFIGVEPGRTMQGKSLFTLLEEPETRIGKAFCEMPGGVARRTVNEKLVVTHGLDRAVLFDLVEDPGETRDIGSDEDARTSELITDVREFLRRNEMIRSGKTPGEVNISDDLKRELEALGYLN